MDRCSATQFLVLWDCVQVKSGLAALCFQCLRVWSTFVVVMCLPCLAQANCWTLRPWQFFKFCFELAAQVHCLNHICLYAVFLLGLIFHSWWCVKWLCSAHSDDALLKTVLKLIVAAWLQSCKQCSLKTCHSWCASHVWSLEPEAWMAITMAIVFVHAACKIMLELSLFMLWQKRQIC